MKSKVLSAALAMATACAGIGAASASSTPTKQGRAPGSWLLIYDDSRPWIAQMKGTTVVDESPLLGMNFNVYAASRTRYWVESNSNSKVYLFAGKSGQAPSRWKVLPDVTGQRTSVWPQADGFFLTDTRPNGEAVVLSYMAYPSGSRVVLSGLNLATESSYLWVEDGISSPVGSSSAYIGAHERLKGSGDRKAKAFVLIRISTAGTLGVFARLDAAQFNNYVTSFCVSKSGKTAAVTYFASRGFRENLAIVDLRTQRVRQLASGDYNISGQCFLSDTELLAGIDDRPYLISIVGSKPRETRLQGVSGGYDMLYLGP